MATKVRALIALTALSICAAALAGEPDIKVVSVHYSVRENDPDKLEKLVTIPVERSVQALERVLSVASSSSHGTVDVEIGFAGNATMQDLKAVSTQIEALKFGADVKILSFDIQLRVPRLSTEH